MEKKLLYRTGKIILFVICANLPFLTIANLVGFDTFIDSFHHPNSYLYMKNDNIQSINGRGGYLILEKPCYQGYEIAEGDTILYHTHDTVQQTIVSHILVEQGLKTYYVTPNDEDDAASPIYEQQIIGKIKGMLDDNPWNIICLQIWDLSIDNLNTVALFSSS
jgi:hypothetical protein